MNLARISLVTGLLCGAVRASDPSAASKPADTKPVPVLYSTDLFHPHDDPDDHFDLATLFAINRLDVRGIVLDLGDRQRQKPGRVPVEQLLKLSGRRVSYATGLSAKLTSPKDDGRTQPVADQGGVDLVLKVLRESPEPVTLITAGSLRDINAAFNREPDLFRRRVGRLYINIGDADGVTEWNVGLDPHAYVGLMRSGLPIYWCPCKPFRDPRSTFWDFRHADVLEAAPVGVQNYFIYALQVVPPELIDPITALRMDLRPWRHLVWGMTRQMWCTASFLHAADTQIVRTEAGKYVPTWPASDRAQPATRTTPAEVFKFVPTFVEINDAANTREMHGQIRDGRPVFRPNMHVFHMTAPANYGKAMTDCLAWLLAHWPVEQAK
jgi:hypothetical protein